MDDKDFMPDEDMGELTDEDREADNENHN